MASYALVKSLLPTILSNADAVVKYARHKEILHDHADLTLCYECEQELRSIAARVMPNCLPEESRAEIAEMEGVVAEAFRFNQVLQEGRNRTGQEL
jgi:hypothetical protein